MAKKAPNPIDKHVGSRVRMRRMMLGMSQEKLGDALGLTFQQVQKYEKGTNRIGASRLQQISQILQVPVSFFFEGAPLPPGRPPGWARPVARLCDRFSRDHRRPCAGQGLHAHQECRSCAAASSIWSRRWPARDAGLSAGSRQRAQPTAAHILTALPDAARNAAAEPARYAPHPNRPHRPVRGVLQCPARTICSPANPFPKAIPTRSATRSPMRSSTRSSRTTSSSASRTTARSTRGSAARRWPPPTRSSSPAKAAARSR